MTKPFRFGVQMSGAESDADWRDQARKVEDLGYSTLYLPDHFVGTQLAPLPAMAIAAAHTTTLRVGSLVFGNDYKHPAVLAKEVATIDLLTDGRVELGLGAGWQRSDYEALGLAYDEPKVRVDRLEEAIAVVKGCWRRGPCTFEGEHYRIRDYDASPLPVQQPGPPLLVGGGGPRVLRLAGREADIVGINPNLRAGEIGPDAVHDALAERTARKVEWVRQGAGDRIDEVELQIRYFLCTITDDRQRFAEAFAGAVGLTPEQVLESGTTLAGTVDEVCEILERRREVWGVTYVVVGIDNVDQFAPVVARLAGT